MAEKNGRSLPEGSLEPFVNSNTKGANVSGFQSIIQSKKLGTALVVGLIFFCQTFSYYGLTIWLRFFATKRGIQNLDPIHAFLVIGISEIPGLALTTFFIERVGRKAAMIVNFIGSAACCSLLLFVRDRTGFLAVSSASYFFIVGCWASLYITTPELFPTTCRASAFSIAGAFGKSAGILSPTIFGWLLDHQYDANVLVGLVVSCFTIAALLSAFFIKETAGHRLTDR